MNSRSFGLLLFMLSACNSTDAGKPVQRIHHEYDYLLANRAKENHHDEFGLGRPPIDVPKARAALLEDSRAEIRVRALMSIAAALAEKGIPDYIAALDDPSIDVVAEAAHELAATGSAYMDRDPSAPAMSALRTHAAGLRTIATTSGAVGVGAVRAHAAEALVFISDRDSLTPFLRDKELAGFGVELAAQLSLSAEEIGLLEKIVRAEPKNTGALRVLVDKSPPVGLPLLKAAIERGDADFEFADVVVAHKFTGAIPGIVRVLAKTPRDYSVMRWIDALAKLNAVCTARAIANILADPVFESSAIVALRSLSGHPDFTELQLEHWAMSQPDDVTPCK